MSDSSIRISELPLITTADKESVIAIVYQGTTYKIKCEDFQKFILNLEHYCYDVELLTKEDKTQYLSITRIINGTKYYERINLNDLISDNTIDFDKLDAELRGRIEQDEADIKYLKNNTYKKSDVYTKSETDAKINAAKTVVDSALSSTSTNPVQNKVVKAALDAAKVTPDTALSTTSTNTVQNKVVTTEINKKANSADVYTKGQVDTQFNTFYDNRVVPLVANAGAPAGAVMAYAGKTAPSGFLFCQGQEVSRTTYSALFTAIGTTYGAGNGSSTFNLPDLRTRVPVGLSSGDDTFGSLNNKGGEKKHVLTNAELAKHGHGVTDPGHSHSQAAHSHQGFRGSGADGSNMNAGGTTGGANGKWTSSAAPTIYGAATGISIQLTGSDSGHNNLQPYITLNYIIKT